MVSRTQMLIKSKFAQASKQQIRVRTSNIARGTGVSGEEVVRSERERITTYIPPEFLGRIVDMRTAREAVDSLTTDNIKGFLGNQDFENLFSNTVEEDRERYARWLFKRFGQPKLKIVRETTITLKSGKRRRGFKLNKEIYLIRIRTETGKSYIQARSFETGRAIGFPRNLLKRIK